MEFSVETIAPCKKKVGIKIPAERIREEMNKKYEEINDAVSMPGFRPGHAPRKLLERRFSGRLGEEMRGELVKTALGELIEKEKIEFLAAPDIDVESIEVSPDQALELEFEAVTKPDFDLPSYKDLEVKIAPISVDDDEVDDAVQQMLRRSATLDTIDGGQVEDDDVLIIDWEAKDGDSVEAKDANVYYPYGKKLLAGFYVEDLDEQLAGEKVGATAKSSVQVAADDPREELVGRELSLEVVLKEIKRYVLPEIDEAFLKQYDFDDEAEMREDLKKQIARGQRRRAEHEASDQLIDQLLESVDIGLPEDFVETELESWASRKRLELEMAEEEEEEIARQVDSGRGDARSTIEADMKRYFLLDRIATEEGIDVTEGELVQSIQEIAQAYGRPIEEVMGSFRDPAQLEELKSQIRQRKAREAVRSAANLVEDPSLAEKNEKKSPEKAVKKKKAKKKAAD